MALIRSSQGIDKYMISKRNFFSITIMMGILLFLFQFFMVMRDGQNVYDVNVHFSQRTSDGQNAWKQQSEDFEQVVQAQKDYVLFIGKQNEDMRTAVARWCVYTKKNLLTYETLADYPTDVETLPEMIILENENYAYGEMMERLETYIKRGSIVVVASLQNPEKIQKHTEMKQFLGIRSVVSTETEIAGFRLFDGLLLGGEVVYEPEDETEWEERMDFDTNLAWYQTASGTKTYMVGLFKEQQEIKNEDLPALIWRNGALGGSVFVSAGDFMSDSTAIGLLDGMLAEANPYTIYPIINAQNLSVVNFPSFADENTETLMALYSRSVRGVIQDIIWPSLVSLTEESRYRMTCFIQPQADYTDEHEPNNEDFIFFLKQLKEQNAEAGISMQYEKIYSLEDKIKRDTQFFEQSPTSYAYGAVFAKEKDVENILEIREGTLFDEASTFVCDHTESHPIVSYVSDDTTLQVATNDIMNYTYRDDLRMRSIQTALGYANISLDVQEVFWSQEKSWEYVQKQFSSNLTTYWKQFSCFSFTTISQSNERIRRFLNLDYQVKEDETELILYTSQADTWFLLRTHDKEISEIVGGSFEQIQDGAYLIYAQTDTVRIALKAPSLHYHR